MEIEKIKPVLFCFENQCYHMIDSAFITHGDYKEFDRNEQIKRKTSRRSRWTTVEQHIRQSRSMQFCIKIVKLIIINVKNDKKKP
jgi:hypothetical protein